MRLHHGAWFGRTEDFLLFLKLQYLHMDFGHIRTFRVKIFYFTYVFKVRRCSF